MADRTRSRAKPPATGDEPKPVKVLLVLGEYDNVLDPASSYAQSTTHRQYDDVEVVDPDGSLSPHNIKRSSNSPVAISVMDMREPRVTVTTMWEVELSRDVDEGCIGGRPHRDIYAACDEAVQAIAVAIALSRRDDPEHEWRIEGVRRRSPVGKL